LIKNNVTVATIFKILYFEMFGETPKASTYLVDNKDAFIEEFLLDYGLERSVAS